MFLRTLSEPIKNFLNKKDELVSKLTRLGIFKVSDMLQYYPRDWEDRSKIVPLKDYRNKAVCTQVKVIGREFLGYGKTRAMKVFIEETENSQGTQAVLVCFNLMKRPWLEKQFVLDSKHKIWGNFKYKYGELQSSDFESGTLGSKNFGKILPIITLVFQSQHT